MWIASLSVSRKLMLIFFVLLFAVSASLGALAIWQSTKAVHEQVEQGLVNIAHNAAEVVQSRMQMHLASVSELARHPDLLTLSDTSLHELTQATQRLGYLGMGWVTPQGVAHYPEGNTADLANRDYIQRALAGEANVSDVIISRVINKPVIMLAAPIRDASTQVVQGVLIARLDATFLSQLTEDLGFGTQGSAVMVNARGQVIASPRPQEVLEQMNLMDDPNPARAAALDTLFRTPDQLVEVPSSAGLSLASSLTIPGTSWKLAITAQADEVFERLNGLKTLFILVSMAAWALSLLLAWWFSRAWVIRPLQHIQAIAHQIETSGNLTLRTQVQGQDELAATGTALNDMVARFQQLISRQSQSTHELLAAAEHLDQTSSLLLTASDQQAEHTNQVAVALDQMSTAIREVAQNTLRASDKAGAAAEEAQFGQQQMQQSQQVVFGLDDHIQQAAQLVEQLNSNTTEVDQILMMISEIAEQTNLLALNAAIEAARAGDHGRGFAVVADEVRTLANRSHTAAASIHDRMQAFRAEAEQALLSMRSCTDFAQQNSQGAEQMGQLLAQSAAHTGEILSLNQQIASATEQQTLVVDQLGYTVQDLSLGIDQVTHKARETAQASDALKKLAASLRQDSQRFHV
ncbi:methyl-accepting chemotaxis protein [Marinospirillum sp.]|uniref:methyl-accepting chemotaxis protein n=1 Tax=Marinospirillum sp. TaxID=2183934 RepID=UPI003A8B2E68